MLESMRKAAEPSSWPRLLQLAALLLMLGTGMQLIVGCYYLVFDRQALRKPLPPPKKKKAKDGRAERKDDIQDEPLPAEQDGLSKKED